MALLVACTQHELELHDNCSAYDRYVLCEREVTYAEAVDTCAYFGGELVDPLDDENVEAAINEAVAVGAMMGVEVWWSGWPDDLPCPIMDTHGAAGGPQDCDATYSVLCEVEP